LVEDGVARKSLGAEECLELRGSALFCLQLPRHSTMKEEDASRSGFDDVTLFEV
jgi:hypothetical protein